MNKKVNINLNLQLRLKTSKAVKYSWDDLSDYQKQHINEGLDDIENSRVMSSQEFWNRLKNG